MGKNYYNILGVKREVSDADLKKAYRKKAIQWHPDKHSAPAAKRKAEETFKAIAEAYDILADPQRRKIYDQYGEEGLKNGVTEASGAASAFYSGVDPNKVYNNVFMWPKGGNIGPGEPDIIFVGIGGNGGANASANQRNGMFRRPGNEPSEPEKPSINEKHLFVTLEEVYNGATKNLKVSRQRFNGKMPFKDDTTITVEVKKGWKDGTRITFQHCGNQETPSSTPADLVFTLTTKKHPSFVRDGHNLIYKHQVTLLQALTGCVVKVELLDKRVKHISIDEIVQPKSRWIIPNEGMPKTKKLNEKGDLIIEFEISFPKRLTNFQKANLKDIFLESTQ